MKNFPPNSGRKKAVDLFPYRPTLKWALKINTV